MTAEVTADDGGDGKDQLYSEGHASLDVPHEVLDHPEVMSTRDVFILNLSWFGLSITFLVLSVVVVPAQIEAMVGARMKGRWLGAMVAAGAVVMFIVGPLVGMASDRVRSRFGRRRPVMMVCTMALFLGLFGMAFMAPHINITQLSARNGSRAEQATPVNGTECVIDLVEQRCRPFANHSTVDVLEDETGALTNITVVEGVFVVKAKSLGLYIGFYLLVAASMTSVTVTYDALIADKSHPSQRGLNSGVMGFMMLFGHISGAALGLFFEELGVIGVYSSVSCVMLVCVIVTCSIITEDAVKVMVDPIDIKGIILGFWEPLKDNDFFWVFATRFLMQQGVATITGFLEFWLSDMVQLPFCWTAQRAVAMMLVPLLCTAAAGSVIFGIVSDRLDRRKPFVVISAMMMCVVVTIMAFIRGPYAYWIAISLTIVFGTGYGCYQAVDFALVLDVLPDDKDKAKDIACWHQALILPQALATPIGGVLLDVFESVNCHIGLGYLIVFLLTGLYFFSSAVFVHKIINVL